jgi:hypothetical protein
MIIINVSRDIARNYFLVCTPTKKFQYGGCATYELSVARHEEFGVMEDHGSTHKFYIILLS